MADTDLNEKIREFIDTALNHFVVQDYNESIRELKAAEVLDKENPEILYNLGICYSRLGLHSTAIDYFSRLLSLPQTFVEVLTAKKLMAYSLIHIENFNEAISLLDDILKKSTNDIPAYSMKGYCLEKTGKYVDAVMTYKQIIDIDSSHANAHNSIAYIVATIEGDLKGALSIALQAVESEPDNPAFLDTLGYIYLKLDQLDEAEKHLKKAASIISFSPEIQQHLLELEEKRGRSDE